MKRITINAERSYDVEIDIAWAEEFEKVLASHNKVLVLVPEEFANSIEIATKASSGVSILHLPQGEAQKSIAVLEKIWDKAAQFGLTRSDAIVGIGGGATTDIAGFAAASWLRGISWYAFPTSIAGMVDAAVGGKTGLNTSAGKNLVGAFHSPNGVFIDLSFLETLPLRDYQAGMAEVVKSGLISDVEILNLLSEAKSNIAELIERSVAVKAKVVSSDFKEGKLREILNYGHTLGHAIEKREGFKWRHGEAVAIGLVYAAELSRDFGLSQAEIELHRELLTSLDLKVSYPSGAFDELFGYMSGDKKTRGNQIRFIGLKKIGEPIWLEELTSDQLRQAYERISS
jgi:3-dehydroquinate synthase